MALLCCSDDNHFADETAKMVLHMVVYSDDHATTKRCWMSYKVFAGLELTAARRVKGQGHQHDGFKVIEV